MGLAGSGRTDEMHGFGAVDELQSGERHDAVLVERGLEGEVEAGEGLDRRELGHLDRHFDAAVLAEGELFGEQASIASMAVISPRSMPRRVTSRISSARGIFRPTRLVLTRSMTEEALIGRLPGRRAGVRRPRRSRASAAARDLPRA